ncbi:flagellar FliJ family protein [Agromyces sp. NPDC057679]|uniref:flagellar FliJ family protein n=1 Tax=Agromyces sp. NPDC057679 TaxID=3346207 RepID=UPI003672BCB0
MAERWSLAGLLRLRQIAQDRAEADLADANWRHRNAERAHERTRSAMSAYGDPALTVEQLRAIAAARTAGASMIQELHTVAKLAEADARDAQFAAQEARQAAKGLKKLEARHLEQQAAEELRVEQSAIDELATNAAIRKEHR